MSELNLWGLWWTNYNKMVSIKTNKKMYLYTNIYETYNNID